MHLCSASWQQTQHHCRLFVWEPLHQYSVHIYQETTSQSVRYFSPCMIVIHKDEVINLLTSRFWGVHGYSLLGISIELWSIIFFKTMWSISGKMDHTPVRNHISGQHGPWHVLLLLNVPLWEVLHGTTIIWLLCWFFLTWSSILGCQ